MRTLVLRAWEEEMHWGFKVLNLSLHSPGQYGLSFSPFSNRSILRLDPTSPCCATGLTFTYESFSQVCESCSSPVVQARSIFIENTGSWALRTSENSFDEIVSIRELTLDPLTATLTAEMELDLVCRIMNRLTGLSLAEPGSNLRSGDQPRLERQWELVRGLSEVIPEGVKVEW